MENKNKSASILVSFFRQAHELDDVGGSLQSSFYHYNRSRKKSIMSLKKAFSKIGQSSTPVKCLHLQSSPINIRDVLYVYRYGDNLAVVHLEME